MTPRKMCWQHHQVKGTLPAKHSRVSIVAIGLTLHLTQVSCKQSKLHTHALLPSPVRSLCRLAGCCLAHMGPATACQPHMAACVEQSSLHVLQAVSTRLSRKPLLRGDRRMTAPRRECMRLAQCSIVKIATVTGAILQTMLATGLDMTATTDQEVLT